MRGHVGRRGVGVKINGFFITTAARAVRVRPQPEHQKSLAYEFCNASHAYELRGRDRGVRTGYVLAMDALRLD